VLKAASLLAGVGVTAACMAAACAALSGKEAASSAAANVAAAEGLAAASWAALGDAAPANLPSLFFSTCCLHLLLSFSLLFLFGGLFFLPRLRVPVTLDGGTVAAADVELLLQQKLAQTAET